jgi:uncharacterized protein YndB with AHSA1/START domain
MTTDPSVTTDFRMPTASKWRAPRAVADGGGGTIIAVAEVAGPPERVFRALTTNEVAGGDTPTPTVRRGGPQTAALRAMERHRSVCRWQHERRKW